MAYLNLDLAFPRHPKTRRLVGLLGRGAEMLLIRLWCHCGEHHCETGALTGYSEQEIETIAEWWGEHGKAVEAMMRVGFLKREDNTFIVKDWLEHSGHLAAFKEWSRTSNQKRWDKHRSRVNDDPIGNPIRSPTGNPLQEDSRLVSSKDSSNGGREFFNPGLHHEIAARAKAIVAYYFARVAPSRASTAAVSERILAQLFLDEPGLVDAAIIAGIDCYAKEVADDKRSMRKPPKKFIEERAWESYGENGPAPTIVEKSEAERARENDKLLKRTIGTA